MEKKRLKVGTFFINHLLYNSDIEANTINRVYHECILLLLLAGISYCSD